MSGSRIVIAALFCFAAGCSTVPELADPALRDVVPGHPRFVGMVDLDPHSGRLTARWHLAFVPDAAARDSLTLYLNAGLRVDSLTGVSVATFVQDQDGDVTVRFVPGLPERRVRELRLFISGSPVFSEDGINRIGPGWVELGLDSEWHPIFAGYAHVLTGLLQLRVPDGWQVIGSGPVTQGNGLVSLKQDIPLIDVPFSAAPRVDSMRNSAATVYYTPGISREDLQPLLDTADACFSYLDQRYGRSDPLPPPKIVLAPRTGPGYARKNYIVITDVRGLTRVGLTNFICHELAHYWSTGANPMSPENWLNEAFAEFVAGRAVREFYGQEAYDTLVARWAEAATGTPPIWTPGGTNRPGPRVSYRKAPHLLHRFEERVGALVMDELLVEYMTRRLSTTAQLLDVVDRLAGADQGRWFRNELAR